MAHVSLKIFFLCGFIGIAHGALLPAAKAANLKKEIDQCMNRWLPPGTSDKDRKWYDPDLRCEANRAVPKLDEQRCEQTVKRLAELSAQLNDSVEDACEKYIPELVADGCEQDSRDPHCIAKVQEILKRASQNSASFDNTLKAYIDRLVKLRKIGLEAAQKIYEATLYSDRRSQAFQDANKYFQNLTGDATAEDFVKRNGNQSSSSLREVLSDFQNHAPSDISGTALGTAAGQAAIAKRAAGLDKAWRTLDQKVPSPLAYEQLVNSLDAEEAHLKMMQYRNDVAQMRRDIGQMQATNEKTLRNLKSIDAADNELANGRPANAIAPVPSGYQPFASESSRAPVAQTASAPAAGFAFSPTFTPVRVPSRPGQALQSGTANSTAVEKITAEKTALDHPSATSGSSRYKAGLRDALRNRLAASSGEATARSPDEARGTEARDLPAASHGRGFGRNLASASSASAAFHDGEGNLSEGGFAIGSLDGGDFASELMGGIQDTVQSEFGAPVHAYIGGLDSSPLFERVKLFHERCLKQGCVRAGNE